MWLKKKTTMHKTVLLPFHRFTTWVTILTHFGQFVTQTWIVIKAKKNSFHSPKKKKKPWSGSGGSLAAALYLFINICSMVDSSKAWHEDILQCIAIGCIIVVAFNLCMQNSQRPVSKYMRVCLNSCTCSCNWENARSVSIKTCIWVSVQNWFLRIHKCNLSWMQRHVFVPPGFKLVWKKSRAAAGENVMKK